MIMLRLTLALLLQLWSLAAFGQEFFVSTNKEDEQFPLVLCCWIHGCIWMCGRWSPRRRTLVVKPTHLVYSRLNSWSARVECLCTFFFINTDYEYYYDYATESPAVDVDTSYDDWIYELLDITGTKSHWDWLVIISLSAPDSFLLPFALNWHRVVSRLPPCVSEHLTWVSLSP